MNKRDFKDHLYSFTGGAVAAAVCLGTAVVGAIATSGAIAAGATPLIVASLLGLAGLSAVICPLLVVSGTDTLLKNKVFKLKPKTMLTAFALAGSAVLALPSKVVFTDKEHIAFLNDKPSTASFLNGKHLKEKFSASSFTTTKRLTACGTHRSPSAAPTTFV